MGALFYYAPKKQNIFFTKKLFAESIPCRDRRFLHSPACPFDVKTQTRIPKEFADYERKLIFYV